MDIRRRHYPNGRLAAHVIGFVNAADNVGQAGIERALDVKLAGKPGRQIAQLTNLRDHPRLARRQLEAPVAGVAVETTIDATLQYMAERELAATVDEFGAEGGAVVIMDPWSGDILAMANAPTYDPNERSDARSDAQQNRAVQHIYEPGSTFKIVIAAAALEVLRLSPSRMFDVSAGFIQFGARRIRDDHRYGQLSFTDVMVKSSNVGAIQIGRELGSVEVSRWVSRLGFGETLAKDIPHQRAGQVRGMASFGPSALASVSMGYQVGVTPLQMVAAVSSIANGGELVAPRIVRATVAGDERTEVPRRVVRRTMNPDTAAELTTILEQVVERGTATRARIAGLHRRREDGDLQEARERPLLGFPLQRLLRRLPPGARAARRDDCRHRQSAPEELLRRHRGSPAVQTIGRGDAPLSARASHGRCPAAGPRGACGRAVGAPTDPGASHRRSADLRDRAGGRPGRDARPPRPERARCHACPVAAGR